MSEPTEQQLDEYLKGDSQVSRRYRELGDVEVPASLDRLVLNQAAEAVKRPARPAWMRWTAPLAAAASLVLVVSVVFQTGAWRDVLQQQAPTVQVDQAAPAAPMEQAVTVEAAGAMAQDKLEVEAELEAAPASVPEPASKPTAMPAATAAATTAGAPAPPPPAPPPPPVPAPSIQMESRRAPAADEAAGASLQRQYADPEAWLKQIRQLRTENNADEANRQWRLFRAAFPDYEVSPTDTAREP